MEMTTLELWGEPFAECAVMTQDFRLMHEMNDDACLSYIYQGKHELFSQSEKITVSNGESVLMKCGNYVGTICEATPINEFRSVLFHVSPETIKKAFGERDISFLNVDPSDAPEDSVLKIDQSKLLDTFVQSMEIYFDKPELATEELLSVKLQELVLILSDSGKNKIATKILGTIKTRAHKEFDEIIQANLYNNLSIPEFAHLTARSESTFKRDFKKFYKDSPAKYFRQKRLEKAAEMLKNKDLQVSEIAWDCGFENAAHFSATFHKAYGTSPKSYRESAVA